MAFPVSPLGFLGSGQPNLYRITKSLRFSQDPTTENNYFYRTPRYEGSRKQFTWSGWFKNLNYNSASELTNNLIFSTATLGTGENTASYLYLNGNRLTYWDRRVGTDGIVIQTSGAFRDPTAWYHFILAVNYLAPLSSDRAAFYVNGVKADVSTQTYPNTGEETYFNDPSKIHVIGSTAGDTLNGYLAEVNYIDGQTLDPSNFGYFDTYSGVWVPKQYSGSYGQNGFYLKFTDTTSLSTYGLGFDYSRTSTPETGLGRYQYTTGPRIITDAFWDSTKLFLPCTFLPQPYNNYPFTGVGPLDNNRFIDSSPNLLSIGATLSATQSSHSPFILPNSTTYSRNFGGSVYLIDGQYLTLPASSQLNLGTGDWTIEFWIKVQDNKNQIGILNIDYDQFEFDRQDTGNGSQYFVNIRGVFAPGGDKSLTSIASASNVRGRWEHVALVKSGTSGTLYVNGVNVTNGGSADFSNININLTDYSYTPWIGRHATNGGTLASYYMRGWLSNFRITKSAVYNGNFIPSTTPLPSIENTSLLLDFTSAGMVDFTQSNTLTLVNGARIQDNSTWPPDMPSSIFNAGSLFLSGGASWSIGAHAFVLPNPSLNLYGTDFTIECYFKANTFSTSNQVIMASRNYFTAGFNGNWILRITSSTTIGFYTYDGTATVQGTDFTVPTMNTTDWYHLAVIRYNGTVRVYLNGVQSTTGPTAVTRTLNDAGNSGLYIGRGGFNNAFNGQLNFIRISNIARYSFDGGAFRYPAANEDYFSSPPLELTQTKGNYVYWAPSQGFSVSQTASYGTENDSMFDTPTPYYDANPRGNYPVMNPICRSPTVLVDRSGLRSRGNHGVAWYGVNSTLAVRTGKWYWEELGVDGTSNIITGVSRVSKTGLDANNAQWYPGYTVGDGSFGYYNATGGIYPGNVSYGNTWTTAVVSHALDLDNKKYFFAINGVWQNSGDPVAGTNPAPVASGILTSFAGDYFQPAVGYYQTNILHQNYGQRPFRYTIPVGYKSLCSANLPPTTIRKPGDFFNSQYYIGTGSTRTVITSGLSGLPAKIEGTTIPDLVWIKNASFSTSHVLTDTARGATFSLSADSTDSQTTEPTGLISFNSSGFEVGSNQTYNAPNSGYISWNWRKNRTAGFDMVVVDKTAGVNETYSHDLGQAPAMMIVKAASPQTGQNWNIYHRYSNTDTNNGSPGGTIYLNSNAAYLAAPTVWNNTVPTAFQFTLGTAWAAGRYIAYLFAEIPGFSRIGYYSANNASDGPYVFCGFKPSFVMCKRRDAADTSSGWMMIDSNIPQNKYNPIRHYLISGSRNSIERTGFGWDFTSTGFKINFSGADGNASSGNYIFAAFAESPFKIARAR